MEIENRTMSYLVFFMKGKRVQKTPLTGVSEDGEIVSLLRSTFKGRFKCPDALEQKDGVKIIVRCYDHIKRQSKKIFYSRIYNKSVTQARQMFELAVKNK